MKADIVKIRVDDNLGAGKKMPAEAYRAVIDQAHKQGLKVAAHIFYLQDAKDVLPPAATSSPTACAMSSSIARSSTS